MVEFLEDPDKYWTLVAYFGSLRELGQCSNLVDDEIKDFIRREAKRAFRSHRIISAADELTSRVTTTELNETLDKLEKINYSVENRENKRYASDIVLATNMISVGIDVARLNVMLIVGQPKLTSEYIQASSRVGRRDPGVVLTLYDSIRSRDRSHYEQFCQYHESFYRYVEPTVATPFSKPARKRALHAILIALLRIMETDLSTDKSAQNYDIRKYKSVTDRIKKTILDRNEDIYKKVYPDADNENDQIEEEIDDILDKWNSTATADSDQHLIYGDSYVAVGLPKETERRLIKPYGGKTVDDERPFDTMTSMRNVDTPVRGNIRIWEE